MLVCRDSARRVSDSFERRLTWSERTAIQAHSLICPSCRRYHKQLMFLQEAVSRIGDQWPDPADIREESLSATVRHRIKASLERE